MPVTITPLSVKIDEHEYIRFAALVDGQYVGTVDVKKSGEVADFRQLFVHSDHRRKRIASQLLLEVGTQATRWGCSRLRAGVSGKNMEAIRFYTTLGFGLLDMEEDEFILTAPADVIHQRHLGALQRYAQKVLETGHRAPSLQPKGAA